MTIDQTTARGRAGILYAEDFDELPLPPAPPAPQAPGITQAELDGAIAMARAEAVHDARMDWQRGALQAQADALMAIAQALTNAEEDARAMAESVAEGLARTILSITVGLLPAACARHGPNELRAVLRRLLPTLAQQPRVVVRLSPAVLEDVRADLTQLDEDLAAAVILTPATLAPGDARVTWTDGALIRDTAAMRAAVTAALTGLGLLELIEDRSLAHAE